VQGMRARRAIAEAQPEAAETSPRGLGLACGHPKSGRSFWRGRGRWRDAQPGDA
jgi:hypothetical protein